MAKDESAGIERCPYLQALNNILTDYISKTSEIIERIAEIRNTFKVELISENINECMQRLDIEKNAACDKVDEAYKSYCERLQQAFTVDGKCANIEDLRLLDGNIFLLSQHDINMLAKKHADNYTMMIAIMQYAKQHGLTVGGFMSESQKRECAEQIAAEAKSYMLNDNGFGVSEYCSEMAGRLFSNATYLSE